MFDPNINFFFGLETIQLKKFFLKKTTFSLLPLNQYFNRHPYAKVSTNVTLNAPTPCYPNDFFTVSP